MDSPIYHLEGVVKAKTEDMEDFVGPLDLILHLLSKNKMEIKDIQISLILDQYLAWMAARKEMDLEVASEFVTMASQLVYIKTRMLLSIHDEEALSEMEQLIASLEEHQRNENYLKIKEITPLLDRRYSYGRDFITKVPETIQPDRTYRYVHDREDLKKAILSVLSRADHQLPPPVAAFQGIVGREPYPVSERQGRSSAGCSGPGSPGSAPCSRVTAAAPRWWPPSWRCWSCARPTACGWPGRRRTVPSPPPRGSRGTI